MTRCLTPAQTAAALKISVKALRLYEAHGLVRPRRTAAGWRVYGGEEIARLHQILVLKGLGLPLKRIAELLAGRLADLDAILSLQQAVLRDRDRQTRAALAVLASARSRLRDGPLTADDLITLAQETRMTQTMTPEDYREVFEPIFQETFTPEELAALGARKAGVYAGWDEQSFGKAWEDLMAEGRALMEGQDRTSVRAQELVRRWRVMTDLFTQGDPDLARKAASVWREAMADPATASRLPMDTALMGFVQSIADGMKAREEA